MNVCVEHADPARDAGDISRLIGVCRAERRTVLNAYTPEEEAEYLMSLGPRDAVFVATVDGEFAGFAGVAARWTYTDRCRHCAEVGTWVTPNHRGMGVSRALLERGVLSWYREKGFTHIGAVVMAHNAGSIAFYERLGFHVCGYHRKVIDWDGELLDSVEIERHIEAVVL